MLKVSIPIKSWKDVSAQKDNEIIIDNNQGLTVLDCCEASTAPSVPRPQNLVPKAQFLEKEQKMNTIAMNVDVNHAAANTLQDERSYLQDRMYVIYADKKNVLKIQHGLLDDEAPEGAEETVARITAGKYVIETRKSWSGNSDQTVFAWRDPSVKKDQAGYSASKITLNKLMQDTKDAIHIKPSIDGLAALQAFETATIN